MADSDKIVDDSDQINEPVDQVYLIGGSFDKRKYASGKKETPLNPALFFISTIITIGSFMK